MSKGLTLIIGSTTNKLFVFSFQIDIDDELLKQYGPRTKPLTVDYLKRRPRPLKIDIYKGDISIEHECLLNSDAIVGIEV
jgi:hypothetical protein